MIEIRKDDVAALRRAAVLINDEERWLQHSFAVLKNGQTIDGISKLRQLHPAEKDISQMCAHTALCVANAYERAAEVRQFNAVYLSLPLQVRAYELQRYDFMGAHLDLMAAALSAANDYAGATHAKTVDLFNNAAATAEEALRNGYFVMAQIPLKRANT